MTVNAGRGAPARLVELDGLRGWAALWVVIFHLGWEIFGVIHPVFRNPVAAAFNGDLAVTLFFVLSGEALSSGYFAGRGLTQVAGLAVKRLPRLGIPIFFSLALTFLLARAGLTGEVRRAAALTQRAEWLGIMSPEGITPLSLVKFPLIDAYVIPFPSFDRLPFLWTMNAEMLGSLIVFVLLLCWERLRHVEWLVPGLGLILLLNYPATNLSGFCFGVALSHWRHRGVLEEMGARRWTAPAAALAILALLVASSAVVLHPALVDQRRVMPVIAPMLVLAVSLCRPLRRFLSNPLSGSLGRLSFPLYLVQYPVIVSVTTALIVRVAGEGPGIPLRHAAGVVAVSLLACLAAAVAFLPVERLTRRVTDAIGRALVKGREVSAI